MFYYYYYFNEVTFAERLKTLRQSKNLTLEKLGSEINSTKATIGNFENGNKKPSLDALIKIANYFEVSLDYLVGRSDDPNFTPQKTD
ncbi:MAG: helix-turn-helix transcriptional regulator [Oscillospiraceae bacterium]